MKLYIKEDSFDDIGFDCKTRYISNFQQDALYDLVDYLVTLGAISGPEDKRIDIIEEPQLDSVQLKLLSDFPTYKKVLDWIKRNNAYVYESRKTRRIGKRLHEKEDVEIEVKHEGILEVPEGKKVDELPLSHFEKLAKKKGLGKITKALNNLQVWNKNDDKKLSKWAGDMIDKLNKKLGKNESISRKRSMKESGMYDYYDTPDNEYGMFTRNDIPTEDYYWYADLTSKMRGIVHEMEELGWEGIGFTTYGRDYGLYQHDKNRPELVYEMFVTIYEGEDSVSLSKYIDIYDEDKDKEISRIPNTSEVSTLRTEDDVRKFTKWFKRLGTSFSTNESKHRR